MQIRLALRHLRQNQGSVMKVSVSERASLKGPKYLKYDRSGREFVGKMKNDRNWERVDKWWESLTEKGTQFELRE